MNSTAALAKKPTKRPTRKHMLCGAAYNPNFGRCSKLTVSERKGDAHMMCADKYLPAAASVHCTHICK